MRCCIVCGQLKDNEEFLSNQPYDRKRGILTKTCADCRAQRNAIRRNWYATHEMKRRGKHVPHA
jgi:hypothetical protein